MIKLRRMKWAGHVACVGERCTDTGFWWEGLREGDHLGDPDVDRSIFRKWDGVWTGSSWLRIVTGGTHLCKC